MFSHSLERVLSGCEKIQKIQKLKMSIECENILAEFTLSIYNVD